MTQTKCKTCWKCGIPVLPLVSLCYHCVPLWYPCGTTGIPPKTQPPLFDDLALRHCWPRTDKCNTYNQTCIHYPFLQHQYCVIVPCNVFDVQLLGNIRFHTDPGWDTDAIVGQFSRSSIIVGGGNMYCERKSSHQIVLPPIYLNQSHQCRSHSISKSKTVHGTTRSSHHTTVASQKADRHSFSHLWMPCLVT